MSITATLARGRRAAQSRMTSRCTIMRKTGDNTTSPEGWEVPEWAAVHVDLPIRLGGSTGASSSRTVTIGESEVVLAVRVASVPADTTDLLDGDLIELTEGENAGLVVQVVEATFQDQATARRLPVVETQRPEEWA